MPSRNTPAIRLVPLLALIVFVGCVGAGAQSAEEHEVEARYLLHFAQLVTWPDDPPGFVLCTLGEDPIEGLLDRMDAGKAVGARPIQIRHLTQVEDATGCQVLFFSSDEDKDLPVLLPALHNAPVLTVGETTDFLLSGGMICFVFNENNVRFEINLDAAKAARLKIGSRLLFLAQTVIGDARAR